MGYQTLVTLDLVDANEDQRKIFYEVLEQQNWFKIPKLTTAWKVSFLDSASREGAIQAIRSDIKKAKEVSKVKLVEYALQLDLAAVIAEKQ